MLANTASDGGEVSNNSLTRIYQDELSVSCCQVNNFVCVHAHARERETG